MATERSRALYQISRQCISCVTEIIAPSRISLTNLQSTTLAHDLRLQRVIRHPDIDLDEDEEQPQPPAIPIGLLRMPERRSQTPNPTKSTDVRPPITPQHPNINLNKDEEEQPQPPAILTSLPARMRTRTFQTPNPAESTDVSPPITPPRHGPVATYRNRSGSTSNDMRDASSRGRVENHNPSFSPSVASYLPLINKEPRSFTAGSDKALEYREQANSYPDASERAPSLSPGFMRMLNDPSISGMDLSTDLFQILTQSSGSSEGTGFQDGDGFVGGEFDFNYDLNTLFDMPSLPSSSSSPVPTPSSSPSLLTLPSLPSSMLAVSGQEPSLYSFPHVTNSQNDTPSNLLGAFEHIPFPSSQAGGNHLGTAFPHGAAAAGPIPTQVLPSVTESHGSQQHTSKALSDYTVPTNDGVIPHIGFPSSPTRIVSNKNNNSHPVIGIRSNPFVNPFRGRDPAQVSTPPSFESELPPTTPDTTIPPRLKRKSPSKIHTPPVDVEPAAPTKKPPTKKARKATTPLVDNELMATVGTRVRKAPSRPDDNWTGAKSKAKNGGRKRSGGAK